MLFGGFRPRIYGLGLRVYGATVFGVVLHVWAQTKKAA